MRRRDSPTPRALLDQAYPFLGIGGSLLVGASIAAAALTYTGEHGEPYSLLNHFISELGQVGVSRNAWLFNAGLIAAGILFILFCIGLRLSLRGIWSILGAAAGVCAGAFCSGVGVFPMNDLRMHLFVAMWFFRCGLATTLLFAIGILAQPRGGARIVKSASFFSLLAVAAYAGFLVLASVKNGRTGWTP
ncbi:MAG: DUF998 domain-containing protein [Spirochaetia bacterium]